MEEAFANMPGVIAATSGYAGGKTSNPTYGAVCSGTTGHAEIVEVEYDPSVISVETLLTAFWDMHDPTMDARHYRGGQYRSAVFYTTPEQQLAVQKSIAKLQPSLGRPIVTDVQPAPTFWRAEEYHQQYYKKNRTAACFR